MSGRLPIALTPRAFADLEHIRDYIVERSPAGADRVREAIVATLEHLASHPLLGRDRPELGVRSIGVPRYAYTIYYRIGADAIEVVHVRDDRRAAVSRDDI